MRRSLFLVVAILCLLLFVAGNILARGPNTALEGSVYGCDFDTCGTMNCLVLVFVSCIDGYLDYSEFVCV